ncbi:hypothetical protein N9A28_00875 [Sulfurimonas sp.]|nr:hypothetical protein [Sulfurimonas sp.]
MSKLIYISAMSFILITLSGCYQAKQMDETVSQSYNNSEKTIKS